MKRRTRPTGNCWLIQGDVRGDLPADQLLLSDSFELDCPCLHHPFRQSFHHEIFLFLQTSARSKHIFMIVMEQKKRMESLWKTEWGWRGYLHYLLMITKKRRLLTRVVNWCVCVCVFGCERGSGWCFCVLFSVFYLGSGGNAEPKLKNYIITQLGNTLHWRRTNRTDGRWTTPYVMSG